MRIQSTFALIDVKRGRKALTKRVRRGERIPVTITGFIDGTWGHDDGESIEFEVTVDKATVGQ